MEIEEAVSILTNALTPIEETEICQLSQAYGRIAARDLFAPINVPPFAKSAMDGYAVRAADLEGASEETPVELKVTGQLFAGDWWEMPPACVCASFRGEMPPTSDSASFPPAMPSAIRVMTGSPIPPGFDAVVMQEDTDYGEQTVRIYKAVRPGQNYCDVGEDIKKDSLVLSAGKRLSRTEIALLASLGFSQVEVRRSARVAILNTGSELAGAGEPLIPGKIYSSIGIMLSTSVKNAGLSVTEEKIIADDEKLIKSEIEAALKNSDLIITTGGISVGKKDLLPKVLSDLGAEKLFSHVNIQPGTPTTASLLQNKLILSLSGNPYAAAANFDIYFYHAAARLMQSPDFIPKVHKAELTADCQNLNKRRRLLRARLDGGKVTLPSHNHLSSVISNMTDCNCYLDLPAESSFKKGDIVDVMMMGD